MELELCSSPARIRNGLPSTTSWRAPCRVSKCGRESSAAACAVPGDATCAAARARQNVRRCVFIVVSLFGIFICGLKLGRRHGEIAPACSFQCGTQGSIGHHHLELSINLAFCQEYKNEFIAFARSLILHLPCFVELTDGPDGLEFPGVKRMRQSCVRPTRNGRRPR